VTPFWEDSVAELAEEIRLDRLLLGSDWPHAEGARQPADFVTESLAGFDPQQIRKIGRDNALSLLGVTLP
jgi:predicted TIM-barrel fold metal-dependent hydrolase